MTSHKTMVEQILLNGEFRTQDPELPVAQAVAIGGGWILAVGDNKTIQRLAGSDTKTSDLGGRLALPGMWDAHFHYYDWAIGLKNPALAGLRSLGEMTGQVAEAVRKTPAGDWILGQGWNETDWPENRYPTRKDLDAVAPCHPVALWRCDLHLASVNSRALELAEITKDTPNPPEGIIVRDADGQPNGILRELAMNLVRDVIPAPDDDEVFNAMRDGIPILHSLGLTSVSDIRLMGGMEGAAAFRGWQRLRESRMLGLRTWVSLPGERLDEIIALGLRTGLGDGYLRVGHVKFFADGGMGARTAWMVVPYLDADCGMPLVSMTDLADAVRRADQAGLGVMIHAIGDRANRELISLFERVEKERTGSGPTIPHRIEHVQMIRPEDIRRLAQLDVIACVQPHNMILDISMIDECVGPKGKWAYAYRDLLDAGIPMLFSSDSPVCSPSPLAGIHAAVTRQREDGTPSGGWYPEQRISVDEAVAGYTIAPARAYGVEIELGSITPGKRADMVILDRNIYTTDPADILNTQVDTTFFDGQIVYQRQL